MLPAGATIGILGDGQLGRMLGLAAAKLGFDVITLGPNEHSPAARIAAHSLKADYTDKQALAELHVRADVITLEFENVPVAAVQTLNDMGSVVRPGIRSLEVCQDRHLEKQFARENDVQTTQYWVINTLSDLKSALNDLNGRGILKTRRDGYDGHGQVRVTSGDDVEAAYARIQGVPAILEKMVPFRGELSVILAQNSEGEIRAFDPAENTHKNGILSTSRVPARFDEATLLTAIEDAKRLIRALDHIGVLAVEFFVLDDGQLLLNEMAPRVHNSGHWTPEACMVSQFEQHIRAIAGWPLAPTDRFLDVEMQNLLGEDVLRDVAPEVSLTRYGKREAREGRKMGHIVRRI